jgi:hypothetical protein
MNRFQLFEAFTNSVANDSLEKEAKKFFSALEPLMTAEITADNAIKSLVDAMSKLPQEKKEAYKTTDAYSDYTNRFVDFFKIS